MAVTHIVMKCIPSVAGAFFIYNANEDNRLCLNPVFQPPEGVIVRNVTRKPSLIPVRIIFNFVFHIGIDIPTGYKKTPREPKCVCVHESYVCLLIIER